MPQPLAPSIPRLPVLSWRYFLDRRSRALPAVTEAPAVLPTVSGRAAIALALKQIGIQEGDRVLVPTFHCPTMVAPIVAFGGIPVFYPLGEHGEARLDRLPAEQLAGVRAAIVPHYFGLPRPMQQVRTLCSEHGITLIEDCAHAFFGRCEGRPIGAWGDYAIASLTKFFPVGEGGCLLSHHHPLHGITLGKRPLKAAFKILFDALETSVHYRRLKGLTFFLRMLFALKRHLQGRQQIPFQVDAGQPRRNLADCVAQALQDFAEGGPMYGRLPRVAWWIARLGGQGRMVARRQRNYLWLVQRLGRLRHARPLEPTLDPDAAPYVFPLWVDTPEACYQAVRRSGVPIYRWDDRWPETPTLEGDSGEKWAYHVFQIGCHQDLGATELAWIADTLELLIDAPRP